MGFRTLVLHKGMVLEGLGFGKQRRPEKSKMSNHPSYSPKPSASCVRYPAKTELVVVFFQLQMKSTLRV